MTDQPLDPTPDTQTPDQPFQPDPNFVPTRALVIVAHADDIEFGAAGTIARWTAAGSHITFCIVTDNGSGSDDPNITRQQLAATREKEQRAAAEVLGVAECVFLGYPDGTVENTLALRRDLVRVMRRARPDLLLTMDPSTLFLPTNTYINHPDHRAVCQAAIDAVFPAVGNRNIFPELLAEGLEPLNVPHIWLMFSMSPNLTVDTSDTFTRKLEALRQHASQFPPDFDPASFIGQWDREAGEKAGFIYGESYRAMKIY
ncbi:MAG: PIG-L family deacetylase [Anaerolineae bacterium]|jgi:LmbE family N-acetylglucosaminyl deacetylase|nr:PIG-L family deacetylase [Anaerolineae bacterium]